MFGPGGRGGDRPGASATSASMATTGCVRPRERATCMAKIWRSGRISRIAGKSCSSCQRHRPAMHARSSRRIGSRRRRLTTQFGQSRPRLAASRRQCKQPTQDSPKSTRSIADPARRSKRPGRVIASGQLADWRDVRDLNRARRHGQRSSWARRRVRADRGRLSLVCPEAAPLAAGLRAMLHFGLSARAPFRFRVRSLYLTLC